MKIKFCISGYELDGLELVEDEKYLQSKFSSDFYYIIKALELNESFNKIIIKARNQLSIPKEGYTLDEYLKLREPWKYDKKNWEKRKDEDYPIFNFKLREKVTNNILKKLNIQLYIYKYAFDIDYIIYANFVLAPPDKIWHGLFASSEDEAAEENFDELQIRIYAPITKHEIITYIENNWINISKDLQKLSSVSRFYISKRDKRIVELRDIEGYSYKKIVDKVLQEFNIDNLEGSINEDAIKTAYARAKAKINSLFIPEKRT